jgi:hypothetical protein
MQEKPQEKARITGFQEAELFNWKKVNTEVEHDNERNPSFEEGLLRAAPTLLARQ